MLQLPNNCRAGKISVHPKNWKTVKASVQLTWMIKYRFYDDNLGEARQVVIKGMNDLEVLAERQTATRMLYEHELATIKKGFNRITGKVYNPAPTEISRDTSFREALDFAAKRIRGGDDTKANIKSCLTYIQKAAVSLKYDVISISDIRARHVLLLLEKCGEIKTKTILVIGKKGQTKNGQWTANTFNQYRANLGMLMKVLKRMEAVDVNYALEIEKEKKVVRIRKTLTEEQSQLVNEVLFTKARSFWRFLHIFFHSGSRETEMLRVKGSDVDLEGQRFMVLVKKGKGNHREEWRTIKTVVLPLWREVMSEAKPDDYLFHEGLVPGAGKPIRTQQISRRWLRHIKIPLEITADFYSLKHSNLDAVAKYLGRKAASKAAGHSSVVVTMEHYLIHEKQREHEELKNVPNSFGK